MAYVPVHRAGPTYPNFDRGGGIATALEAIAAYQEAERERMARETVSRAYADAGGGEAGMAAAEAALMDAGMFEQAIRMRQNLVNTGQLRVREEELAARNKPQVAPFQAFTRDGVDYSRSVDPVTGEITYGPGGAPPPPDEPEPDAPSLSPDAFFAQGVAEGRYTNTTEGMEAAIRDRAAAGWRPRAERKPAEDDIDDDDVAYALLLDPQGYEDAFRDEDQRWEIYRRINRFDPKAAIAYRPTRKGYAKRAQALADTYAREAAQLAPGEAPTEAMNAAERTYVDSVRPHLSCRDKMEWDRMIHVQIPDDCPGNIGGVGAAPAPDAPDEDEEAPEPTPTTDAGMTGAGGAGRPRPPRRSVRGETRRRDQDRRETRRRRGVPGSDELDKIERSLSQGR